MGFLRRMIGGVCGMHEYRVMIEKVSKMNNNMQKTDDIR